MRFTLILHLVLNRIKLWLLRYEASSSKYFSPRLVGTANLKDDLLQPDGASVNRWTSSCTDDVGIDPNQPHLRLLAQHLRRVKKRLRTPSPVKKSSYCAPKYRNRTMKLALVFIECDPELPVHIAEHVARILETNTMSSGRVGDDGAVLGTLVATLVETFAC
ncbi:hypothetical protein GQ44DRAFT_34767 [Phaeosphaeriaceae sp. PMI808]|nr:hypothetical protein GQ44DRAFT_34767 [Phaeosphaeriaceae sp. PMI808]